MYCRNYTGTASLVLCREVYYTVSSFGRVHYQRFHCTHVLVHVHTYVRMYVHVQVRVCVTCTVYVRMYVPYTILCDG